jgi:hypothetical protein
VAADQEAIVSASTDGTMRRLPHLDLWTLGAVFFLSRLHWIMAQYYLADVRGSQAILVSLLASLLLVLGSYILVKLVGQRSSSYLARAAVLAMFMYFVEVQVRLQVGPSRGLSLPWQVAIGVLGLLLATIGAARLAAVWPRLRLALLVAATIATTSVFALAAILAPHIELLADSHPNHRPVIVFLLDEFSAASSQDLVAALAGRELRVESWAVPSIGRNTLDAIPAIFTGGKLLSARPCTSTAVCGRGRVVDFARMKVTRNDVDIVGTYHRYCSIEGLRFCVGTQGDDLPPLRSFLCALPSRVLMESRIGCNRKGYAEFGLDVSTVVDRELMAAPFWRQGGLLYAHLIAPHPPGESGEARLADAYAANLVRTRELMLKVIDRLERAPFHEDFTLVITSDHHLRSEIWCAIEPYASHDCELPESMRGAAVPFIVATRGAPVAHRAPTSNADLMPIVVELARAR